MVTLASPKEKVHRDRPEKRRVEFFLVLRSRHSAHAQPIYTARRSSSVAVFYVVVAFPHFQIADVQSASSNRLRASFQTFAFFQRGASRIILFDRVAILSGHSALCEFLRSQHCVSSEAAVE